MVTANYSLEHYDQIGENCGIIESLDFSRSILKTFPNLLNATTKSKEEIDTDNKDCNQGKVC